MLLNPELGVTQLREKMFSHEANFFPQNQSNCVTPIQNITFSTNAQQLFGIYWILGCKEFNQVAEARGGAVMRV